MAHKYPIPPKPVRREDDAGARPTEDELLDEALEESFPASDPPAIVQPDDGHEEEHAKDTGRDRPRHRDDRP